MDNTHVVKKKITLKVKKKPLVHVLLCIGSLSLQVRTKLKKVIKNIAVSCK